MRKILNLLILCFIPFLTFSQNNPLEPFSKLIGGSWHQDDNSYQRFEWGLDSTIVKAKSYVVENGQPEVVSEGMWFYHPGTNVIKGYFIATKMPVHLFDYNVKFQQDSIILELKSFTKSGAQQEYREIWEFIDDNTYIWALYQKNESQPVKLMEEKFIRR